MRFSHSRLFVVMGTTVATLLAINIAQAQSQLGAPSDRLVLKEGVDVPLKFAEDLSSKTAAEGDPVTFILGEDVKVGNVVVAKAGTKAFGEITNAKKSGMMGKAGELNVRLNYLRLVTKR